MNKIYSLRTGTYQTTLLLTFSDHIFDAGIFSEIFSIDPKTPVTVSSSRTTTFINLSFINGNNKSLNKLIETIEAAGFTTKTANL